MSRASNTYLVTSESLPVASFTVKYEMENFLDSEFCPSEPTVYRIEDVGRFPRAPKITEITDKYYEWTTLN